MAEYVSESVRAAMQDLAQRAEAAQAEVARLTAVNQRLATRIAGYRQGVEEQLDPTFNALARIRELVSDWQANGNSSALGDPTASVWQKCARQLLDALDGEVGRG